ATVSGLGSVGGTSASSPSFAGLMALINQKTGTSWGNANTKFYTLANAQYASGGTVMFHDVTSGNNSVPGVTGFSCGTGNDTVTVTGTGGATSHTTTVALAVTSGGGSSLTNGTFETGNLTGWTGSGVTAVNTAAKHSGTYGAQLGNTSPSTDSSIAQTFT